MLKIVSYNIHKGVGLDRRRDPDRILAVLKEVDADIVVLQEADRRFGTRAEVIPRHLLAERSDWKAVALQEGGASMGWHGNVILVRRTMEVRHVARLHLPALEPRGAVLAEVAIGDTPLRIVGMHLDLSGLWRRRQAAAVLHAVAERDPAMPTVMTGDLNDWTAASGCLRDFGQAFAFAATGPSFHARRPIARLDRIMVSPALAVVACGVHASPLSRIASDHLPVWATVERR